MKNIKMLVGIVFCLVLCACPDAPPDTEDTNPAPEIPGEEIDVTTVLNELGIDTDLEDLDRRAGYNPYSSKYSSPFTQSELFVAGFSCLDTTQTLLNLEKVQGSLEISNYSTFDDMDSWVTKRKKSIGGDFDGDGFDELIIVYVSDSQLMADYYDMNNVDPSTVPIPKSQITHFRDTVYSNGDTIDNGFLDICTGDVDGDDKDELLLTYCSPGEFNRFSIFDVTSSAIQEQKSFIYETSSAGDFPMTKLDAGDIDDDGVDEICVVISLNNCAEYFIYDDGATGYSVISSENSESTPVYVDDKIAKSGDTAIGDYDADGLNEILLLGRTDTSGDSNYIVKIIDDNYPGNDLLTLAESSFVISVADPTIISWDVIAESLDYCSVTSEDVRVRKDEMLLNNEVYRLDIADNSFDKIDTLPYYFRCNNNFDWMPPLSTGDINGDGWDEIIMFNEDSENNCIYISKRGTESSSTGIEITNTISSDYPVFTCLNLDDNDSFVLKYLDKQTLFYQPEIIAVLACSPYYNGINTPGNTAIGFSQNSTVENAYTLGFSAGISFGYSVSLDFIGVSDSLCFTTSLDHTTRNSVSITSQIQFSSTGEDSVIFEATPYDIYHYSIISERDSSETDFYISVPRDPIIKICERDFFNAHNGNGIDIGSDVFPHTIGNPSTYQSEEEVNDKYADLMIGSTGTNTNYSATVGIGSSETQISYCETLSYGYSTGGSLSFSWEREGSAIVTGTTTLTTYAEAENSVDFSESTAFFGSVNSIPQDNYESRYDYSWGLFGAKPNIEGKDFIMINYWVELP